MKLKLPSWIAAKLGFACSGWLTLEEPVKEGTTLAGFLDGMAAAYPGFRDAAYNPAAGIVTEQVNVALNGRVLDYREISQVKLGDGDDIMLVPIYYGG